MEDTKVYNAVVYCRLSREDGDKSESDSIGNQKALIMDFVKNKPDINVVSVKTDDGYTGVNFERPAFKEMLEDIRTGTVNCIIVKDLSRFARNYIDAGKYLEDVFPFMGVRFIAVNDNYDTLQKSGNDSIIVPFKNLLNDAFCRDISIKTRTNLDIKRKRGDYTSPFAPYGYKRSESDKNIIEIDESAAQVVRDIFNMRIAGVSCQEIAHRLNEAGKPTPSEYKKLQGSNYVSGFSKKSNHKWTHTMIISIIKNPIYIGTLIQGKTTTPNYKIKKRFTKPKNEWSVIENNHEAIISKEKFDTVNELFKYDTKTPHGKGEVYLFSGKLFCSECGGNLVRKRTVRNGKEYVYYTCATKLKDKNKCTSHRVNEKELAECVVISIRSHIDRTCDIRTALEIINKLKLKPSEIEIADKDLKDAENLLKDYKVHKASLAESCAKGIINKNDYNEFGKIYDEKISSTEKRISDLKNNIKRLLKNNEEKFSWIDEFTNYGNITELNRNAVVSFIERIIVHEGNKIEIIFNHKDEFDTIISFLENSYDVMIEKTNS